MIFLVHFSDAIPHIFPSSQTIRSIWALALGPDKGSYLQRKGCLRHHLDSPSSSTSMHKGKQYYALKFLDFTFTAAILPRASDTTWIPLLPRVLINRYLLDHVHEPGAQFELTGFSRANLWSQGKCLNWRVSS